MELGSFTFIQRPIKIHIKSMNLDSLKKSPTELSPVELLALISHRREMRHASHSPVVKKLTLRKIRRDAHETAKKMTWEELLQEAEASKQMLERMRDGMG